MTVLGTIDENWKSLTQVGDLIKDLGDGEFGVVLTEVCSYNTIEGPAGHYVMVKWNGRPRPQKMLMTAIANGWVEIISEGR